MTVRAVRERGKRDRFFVERADGGRSAWDMASYGAVLPHDLVHLAAESVLGLRNGVWGRIAAGADLGHIAQRARRIGGTVGYAALLGDDPQGIVVAEALANAPWLEGSDRRAEYWAGCADQLGPAGVPGAEPQARVRGLIRAWTGRWQAVGKKGTLVLEWDLCGPARLLGEPRRQDTQRYDAKRTH